MRALRHTFLLDLVHQLLYEWSYINVKAFRGSKVWITAGFVEHNLRHTLLNEFVIGRSDLGVISDAQ